MSEKIEIAELLDHITNQIATAHNTAVDRGFSTMEFKECELEFAVETSKEADGGIRVWLLNLGGKAKKSNSNTIRLKYGKIDGAISIQAPQGTHEEEGPELEKQ